MRRAHAVSAEGEGRPNPARCEEAFGSPSQPSEQGTPFAQGSVRRLASSLLRLPPRSHVNDIMKRRWPVTERTKMLAASDRKAQRHGTAKSCSRAFRRARTRPPKARPFVAVTPITLLPAHAFPTLGTTRTLLPSSALSCPKSLLQSCSRGGFVADCELASGKRAHMRLW
jgi:hypothetical protein